MKSKKGKGKKKDLTWLWIIGGVIVVGSVVFFTQCGNGKCGEIGRKIDQAFGLGQQQALIARQVTPRDNFQYSNESKRYEYHHPY